MQYVTLETTYGKIKGIQYADHQLYKGIRYATAKRFQRPELYCSEADVYDATHFGYTCPQPGQQEGSFYDREFWHHKEYSTPHNEDCLYLNIWRPNEGENLPVALWIHGGAFVNGFGLKVEIDGGYYCGNYGIYDQLCAIEWVRKHIASFGGNPDHIIIMGQSAGAMSIQTLISSPLLPEGVVGAVMQSGGGLENFLNDSKTIQSQKELHGELLRELGIESLEQLLQADVVELVAKSCEFTERKKIPNLLFAPVIHTDLLPDTYENLVYRGIVRNIPCVIGCAANDITVGDVLEEAPVYKGCINWALAMEKVGYCPSYVYVFDRAPLGGEGQGAFHSGDLWYSFHTLDRSWRKKEDIDYRIADEMCQRWIVFIRTGTPNDNVDGTMEAIEEIARYEISVGVTAIAPATMTLPLSDLEQILSVAAAYKNNAIKSQANINKAAEPVNAMVRLLLEKGGFGAAE